MHNKLCHYYWGHKVPTLCQNLLGTDWISPMTPFMLDFSSNGVSYKGNKIFETISCHFYFTYIFPFENVENIIWIWKVLHRIWKALQWNPKSDA